MSVATSAALDTTVVVTSCGRHDLLAHTLQSFRLYNTDRAVARILVVEDGSTDPTAVCRSFGAEVICTGARVGQLRAIDLAYAQVHTPYIFHLEDDWEFYRSGFIEKSREFLKDPSILLVWLRAWNDTNGHPLSFEAPDGSYGVLATHHCNFWHGFTFNPGLRRLSDYQRIGSYAGQSLTLKGVWRTPAAALPYEVEANQFYFRHGYRAVILDRNGYVRHTGGDRHVTHPLDQVVIGVGLSRNAPCPCGSGKRFKHCHGAYK